MTDLPLDIERALIKRLGRAIYEAARERVAAEQQPANDTAPPAAQPARVRSRP